MSAHRWGNRLGFCAKTLLGAGLLMLVAVWLFEDEFPSPDEILPQTIREPIQQPTSAPLFTTRRDSVEHDRGAYRKSSTIRNDTGPGACESVFVESFDIMRRGNSHHWQLLRWLGVFCVLVSLALSVILAFLPDNFHFNGE